MLRSSRGQKRGGTCCRCAKLKGRAAGKRCRDPGRHQERTHSGCTAADTIRSADTPARACGASVRGVLDPSDGSDAPFGRRCGGCLFVQLRQVCAVAADAVWRRRRTSSIPRALDAMRFCRVLERITVHEHIDDRAVEVRSYDKAAEARGCAIVYLGRSEAGADRPGSGGASGRELRPPAGDDPQFLSRGGYAAVCAARPPGSVCRESGRGWPK